MHVLKFEKVLNCYVISLQTLPLFTYSLLQMQIIKYISYIFIIVENKKVYCATHFTLKRSSSSESSEIKSVIAFIIAS